MYKRQVEVEAEQRRQEVARQEQLRKQQEAAAAGEQKARRDRLLRIKGQIEQQYKQAIRKAVSGKFRPPSGIRPGATCTVLVRLVPPNQIVDVRVQQCSGGGEVMSRAVEKAVLASQPFPIPRHMSVFQRELIFEFKPGG